MSKNGTEYNEMTKKTEDEIIADAQTEEEVELSEEEQVTLTRMYEDDVLAGLLAAAKYKTDEEETRNIQIIRGGAIVLEFRIRPMSEDEYNECKKKNTNYKRNRQLGTKVPDSLNTPRFRSELIYRATVDQDREKIWDNHKAWEKLSVINGIDLVDVILKAGEKDEILRNLDEMSGFKPALEDMAKN